MNKQIIYTIMGIIFSFVIAIGGWLVTSTLINKQADEILSVSEAIVISMPTSFNQENISQEVMSLTDDEIINILRNWELNTPERPHEPTGEQISMGQAIEIGRAWLLHFEDIIPLEMLGVTHTSAYLCQKIERGQENFLDPMYSYWTVSYSGDFIVAVFTINSVTGQIWKVELSLIQFENDKRITFNREDAENMLAVFISEIGIEIDEETSSESWFEQPDGVKSVILHEHLGITLFQSFANGNASAVINAMGRQMEKEEWFLTNLSLFLMTNHSDSFWSQRREAEASSNFQRENTIGR